MHSPISSIEISSKKLSKCKSVLSNFQHRGSRVSSQRGDTGSEARPQGEKLMGQLIAMHQKVSGTDQKVMFIDSKHCLRQPCKYHVKNGLRDQFAKSVNR